MFLLLIYLFSALFISFFCSLVEAALLSTPASFLKSQRGNKKYADKLAFLKQDIDKPLSAILSLNTIAHTIGAAGVGAQSVSVFGEEYFGVISAVVTLLILVITEIIPKTIGAKYWNKLTALAYIVISFMIIITYPLVLLSNILAGLISRKKNHPTTSREEIIALAEIAAEEGILIDKEIKIIQNSIMMRNIIIGQLMTPRIVVTSAPADMKLSEFMQNRNYLYFSRIPVFITSVDQTTGYIFRQDVFEKLAEGDNKMRLSDLKRDIIYFDEKESALKVWETMLEKKEHISLITDEFGGMAGIVTMEDILETLLGFEIIDEKDRIADLQAFARDNWNKKQEKYRLMYQVNKEINPEMSGNRFSVGDEKFDG